MNGDHQPKSSVLRRISFVEDSGGGVAIMFALLCVCMLGLAGGAIDLARQSNLQTKLQQAVDAAALAAAKNPYYTSTQATDLAKRYFAANTDSAITKIKPFLTISRDITRGSEITVKAEAVMPTTLLAVLGFDTLVVNAHSQARSIVGESEIYAAIDMSASLGLAADPLARAQMEAATAAATGGANTCMFACHQLDGWEPNGESLHKLAKKNGIALREDVLEKAFGVFVDTFLKSGDPAVAANHKRVAVIGFSESARLLQASSSDANLIKFAPNKFLDADRTNTNFAVSLPQIKTMLGNQGTGLLGSPKKALLLITDGLQWQRSGAGPGNGPISQALCDSIKSTGVALAVIDVQYWEATGEYWFETQVRPMYTSISPALEKCATAGLYFQATDSDTTTLAETFNDAAQALKSKLALSQ